MPEPPRRVLLFGAWGPGALERAYADGFCDAGCEVLRFDMPAAEAAHVRLGAAGRLFNKFVPVEPWIRKANRSFFLQARAFRPDLIVSFGQSRLLAGTLAQTLIATGSRSVYVWQDTLMALSGDRIDLLPLFDVVASYSREAIPALRRLGAREVAWVPLAGPSKAFPGGVGNSALTADVSFIGQWRPEREAALTALLDGCPGLDVKIWGPDWGRRGNASVRRVWQRNPLFGEEYASAIRGSRVNLNIIDDTNYPAANTRFFEILCIGGLQLSSPCPEMEEEFRDGVEVCYYPRPDDIPALVGGLLRDEARRREIARAGETKACHGHTFLNRARQLLSLAGIRSDGGNPP